MLSVQQRFNRASRTYDDVASVQKICARKLSKEIMERRGKQSWSSVLDLGSGTGCMFEALLPHLSESRFTLADFSPNMIACTAEKFQNFSNIQYQCVDFEKYCFDFHDLTVSNLALQWVKNWQEVVSRYFHNTRVLGFSLLLDGSFDNWYARLNDNLQKPAVVNYPSEEHVVEYLKTFDADIFTQSDEYTLSFANTAALMKYLRALGASKSHMDIPFPIVKKMWACTEPIQVKYRVFYGVMQRWSL
jgi:malonyl-CoA O-methyltransferase